MKLKIEVHRDGEAYWAEAPESCPGLFATGTTLDELLAGIVEAFHLHQEISPDGARGMVAEVRTIQMDFVPREGESTRAERRGKRA